MAFCKNCGKELSAETKFCPECGSSTIEEVTLQSSKPATPPVVENHLTKAILVTVFCCVPLGIVSIVKAASVNGKIASGDIAGAEVASKEADNWANWAIGLGLAVGALYFVATLASL